MRKNGIASRILHGMRVVLKHDKEDSEKVEIINGRIVGKNEGGINHKAESERKVEAPVLSETPPKVPTVGDSTDTKTEESGGTDSKVDNSHSSPAESNKQEVKKDSVSEEKRSEVNTVDIESFITSLKAAGKSKQTITGYKSDLRFWKKMADKKNKTVETLSFKEIEEIIANHDKNTARRRLSCLRQLGKWQLRNGPTKLHLEIQKCYAIKRKARVPRAKTIKEYRRIRKQAQELCQKYDRRGIWLGLMISCGLRISEIQTTEITGNSIKVLGKGDKERVIPCPGWLIKAMEKLPKRARGGYQRCRQNIDRELRKMQYSKMHSLRHTYATVLIRNGVNIEDIQKLLGHNELSTTQVYAQNKIPNNICETLANA